LGNAFHFWGRQDTVIVVDVPNAMVVAVSYENFDVILFLIEVAADTAGLV